MHIKTCHLSLIKSVLHITSNQKNDEVFSQQHSKKAPPVFSVQLQVGLK